MYKIIIMSLLALSISACSTSPYSMNKGMDKMEGMDCSEHMKSMDEMECMDCSEHMKSMDEMEHLGE